MLGLICAVLSLSVVFSEEPTESSRTAKGYIKGHPTEYSRTAKGYIKGCPSCDPNYDPRIPVEETVPDESISYDTALLFGDDGFGVITFRPDMSRLAHKFSFCLWIRKMQSGGFPCVFTYEPRDFIMRITPRRYHSLFFTQLTVGNEFTVPLGVWYHLCGTWSSRSRYFQLYIDGRLAGSVTTPYGKEVPTGGTMVLGDFVDPFLRGGITNNHFGGEMYNFNMFSKELTAAEVAELSADGLCTEVPEELDDYKVIKWEKILRLNRRGTVHDVDTGCAKLHAMEMKLQEMKNNCGDE